VRFDIDAWFKAREAYDFIAQERAAKGEAFAQRLLERYQVELVKKALLQSTERRKPT
jgi:hypothetical protein